MGALLSDLVTVKETHDPHSQFIKDLIDTNKIVVFSKSNCGYCDKAKRRLDRLNKKYHAVELDNNSNCPESNCERVIQNLILQTRMRTVPQIFIDGKLIGGYIDLEKLIESGKLDSEKS